jgi:hypothetical protein
MCLARTSSAAALDLPYTLAGLCGVSSGTGMWSGAP